MSHSGSSSNIILTKVDTLVDPLTTVTGTGWAGALPVTNIITPTLSLVARSSTTEASILLDFGRSRPSRVIAIPKHSISSEATWRVRFSDDANLLTSPDNVQLSDIIYDSQTILSYRASFSSINMATVTTATLVVDVVSDYQVGSDIRVQNADYTEYFTATITNWVPGTKTLTATVNSKVGSSVIAAWEIVEMSTNPRIWPVADTFGNAFVGEFTWDGSITGSADILPAILILEQELAPGRYMRIDIYDSTNARGYFDVGKLIVSPGWAPTLNLEFGWALQYVDSSPTIRSRTGAIYSDYVPKYRQLKIRLNALTRDEMFGNILKLDIRNGVSDPFLVVIDPTDTSNLHRLSIYGTQKQISGIVNRAPESYYRDLVIEEWL